MRTSRFFLFGFLLLLCGCANEAALPRIGKARLPIAMKDGADYLVRASQPSGEFVYLANLQPGKIYKPVYNVLRHAGALYVLADYYSYQSDPKVKSALVRSANFLKRKYMLPVEGEKNSGDLGAAFRP